MWHTIHNLEILREIDNNFHFIYTALHENKKEYAYE